MDSGADICVQSAHKTLPALTQGSYLHVKSEKIDLEKLRMILSMLQTSSPHILSWQCLMLPEISWIDMERFYSPELLEHIESSDIIQKKEIFHGFPDQIFLTGIKIQQELL